MNRMMMISAIVVAGAAGAITIAPGADARSRDTSWQQAKPVGEPVDCINAHSISSTRVRSDKVIDFYMAGKKVMRNELPYSCSSLGFEERFTYSPTNNRLCSVDTITVLHSAGGVSRGASCGLGKFQQVELPKK